MRPAIEFDVGEVHYRADRLSAFKQFAIVRRLGKVVGAFGEALEAWKRTAPAASGGATVSAPPFDPLALLEPFLLALSELRDEDVDFILSTCLAQVSRQQASGWARLVVTGHLMFEDVDDMAVMGRIVWGVLQGSLADFFTELLSALPGPAATESTGSGSQAARSG